MLADIWQNAPQIIKEAATSPLGLLALMIIALAILAFFFFKDAGVPVPIAIFITSFAAVVVFAAKIAYKANEVALPNAVPSLDRKRLLELITIGHNTKFGHLGARSPLWAYSVFTYSINSFFCSSVRFVPKL